MLTLYFAPGSSSMAPHIAPHEVEAPFKGQPISLGKKQNRMPDYLAINPEGNVPTLLIDGRPLTEVAAILFYLARTFPQARLLPVGDIELEAQVVSWDVLYCGHCASGTASGSRPRSRHICHRRQKTRRPGVGNRAMLNRRYSSVPAVLASLQITETVTRRTPATF
jgi:glutathione S-transferase